MTDRGDLPNCRHPEAQVWRLVAGGPWTCSTCHPPVVGLEVEWDWGRAWDRGVVTKTGIEWELGVAR